MESPAEKVEGIRVRVTLSSNNNVLACISDIEFLRKLIPEKKNNVVGEIALNPGDVITFEGTKYEIKDVKTRLYNNILDLEKFGVNICGAGKEVPYNFQIIYKVEKLQIS